MQYVSKISPPSFRSYRVRLFSRTLMVEQPDRALECRWTHMHVPLRRGEILVSRQFLNGPRRRSSHREMRAERVPQSMYSALAELSAPCGPFHMMLHHISR